MSVQILFYSIFSNVCKAHGDRDYWGIELEKKKSGYYHWSKSAVSVTPFNGFLANFDLYPFTPSFGSSDLISKSQRDYHEIGIIHRIRPISTVTQTPTGLTDHFYDAYPILCARS